MTPKTKKTKILTKEIVLPTLYPLQMQVVKDPHRFKVLACGRRWGKTRMCSLIAIERAFAGKRVWWIGPTYQVARIGWREVTTIVSQFPVPIAVREGSLTVEFPSGGFVAFKSADAPDNLRGEGLDYLIMDEADFVKRDVWEQILRPSLADRKGGAIFISTPKVEGGWFHKMFLKGQKDDPETKSWQFSSYTNPFLDPKEIDSSREDLPSMVFRQEFLAEFLSSEGARVKQEWIKYEETPPKQLRPNWKIAIGVDLAISEKTTADFTAVAVLGRSPEGIVHVMDIRRERTSFASQVELIKSMASKWEPDVIGIESTAYQRAMVQAISAATTYTVRGIKTTKDKITNFSPLEARYEHGQVYHSRNLPPYFEQELLSFPNGEHDDMVDACRLAFEALKTLPMTGGSGVIAPIVSEKNDGFKHIGKRGDNIPWVPR